jgi:hypothetical protein
MQYGPRWCMQPKRSRNKLRGRLYPRQYIFKRKVCYEIVLRTTTLDQ